MNKVLARLMKDQRELKLSGINLETLRAAYDKERTTREEAIKQSDLRRAGVGAGLTEDARRTELKKIADEIAHIATLMALPADAEKCHGGAGG